MGDPGFEQRLVDAVEFVQTSFAALADAEAAVGMASYMKTEMPFYGIKQPARAPIFRELITRLDIGSRYQYEVAVRRLWALPHREEKYLAIGIASDLRSYVVGESLALYEHLIVDGAWWDFVDHVAARCVGMVLLQEREAVAPTMETWIAHDDMWLRRSALLAHLGHKSHTDASTLFDHCLRLAAGKEFFIRKAIGWVLRDYAKTAPEDVRRFVLANRDRWSGLTYREAMKHLEPVSPAEA